MNDSLFSVSDQVVLVSGASRGIGKRLAQGFAERGAQVVITGRQQDTQETTADELSKKGNLDSMFGVEWSWDNERSTFAYGS